jgi:hypothetical protein
VTAPHVPGAEVTYPVWVPLVFSGRSSPSLTARRLLRPNPWLRRRGALDLGRRPLLRRHAMPLRTWRRCAAGILLMLKQQRGRLWSRLQAQPSRPHLRLLGPPPCSAAPPSAGLRAAPGAQTTYSSTARRLTMMGIIDTTPASVHLLARLNPAREGDNGQLRHMLDGRFVSCDPAWSPSAGAHRATPRIQERPWPCGTGDSSPQALRLVSRNGQRARPPQFHALRHGTRLRTAALQRRAATLADRSSYCLRCGVNARRTGTGVR